MKRVKTCSLSAASRLIARNPEVAAGIAAWDRTLARSREQLKRFLDERAAGQVSVESGAD